MHDPAALASNLHSVLELVGPKMSYFLFARMDAAPARIHVQAVAIPNDATGRLGVPHHTFIRRWTIHYTI